MGNVPSATSPTHYFATLPFQQLDFLVVDELGKNVSGTGMDLNIIGKWRISGRDPKPDYRLVG